MLPNGSRPCFDCWPTRIILRGLTRRDSGIDVVRVQDVGLSGADDPTVLAWAAEAGRVLITHDVNTVTRFAYERVKAGRAMPGVFEVPHNVTVGQAIEDILLLIRCSSKDQWEGQVCYLPL